MNVSEVLLHVVFQPFPAIPAARGAAASDRGAVLETICRLTSIT
jgi:hypothetical protein